MDQELRESFAEVFRKLNDLKDDGFKFQLGMSERVTGMESDLKSINKTLGYHCADRGLHGSNGNGKNSVKIGAKEIIYIILTLAGVIGILATVINKGA
jgi:uncharacterized membrane protein YkgB